MIEVYFDICIIIKIKLLWLKVKVSIGDVFKNVEKIYCLNRIVFRYGLNIFKSIVEECIYICFKVYVFNLFLCLNLGIF